MDLPEISKTLCPHCWGGRGEPGNPGSGCTFCRAAGEVEDAHLSAHFRRSELWGRARYLEPGDPRLHFWDGRSFLHPGVSLLSNAPTPDQLERAQFHAVHLLEPFRAGYVGGPISLTSWFRCQRIDGIIAGPPFDRQLSGHSTASATDVDPGCLPAPAQALPALLVSERVSRMRAAILWLLGSPLTWDQVILEGGCLHLASEAPYPVRPPGTGLQRRQVIVRVAARAGSGRAFDYPPFKKDDLEQLMRVA